VASVVIREGPEGDREMNAVEIENELMDPVDYWQIHRESWHKAGDVAGFCHYPNLANFYYDLEEDAKWVLTDVLGISLN
jgi:hypothetical protein